MRKISIMLILLVLFYSNVFSMGLFDQTFIEDINKLKKINEITLQSLNKVGYIWNDLQKSEENEHYKQIKIKHYDSDSLEVNAAIVLNKKENRYEINYEIKNKLKESNDIIQKEIQNLLGKEYKTIDYGFFNKSPITGIRAIKQDYIINNLRFRFSSNIYTFNNQEMGVLNDLFVWPYNKNEDLVDLIGLKFSPIEITSLKQNRTVKSNIEPFIMVVDFNDNMLLNANYFYKGKIIEDNKSFIKTEYMESGKKKISFYIDRVSGTFSEEVQDEFDTVIARGTYERIDLNHSIF